MHGVFFNVCSAISFSIANWAQSVLALIFNMICNLLDKPQFLQQLDKQGCFHGILQVFLQSWAFLPICSILILSPSNGK